MFTGIVEQPCPVVAVAPRDGLVTLRIDLEGLDGEPPVGLGDSVALDGVCLTVTGLEGRVASFDVVPETLRLTTLGGLAPGSRVHVERALRFGDRLDGHLVQGHVEGTGEVLEAERTPGELRLTVGCGKAFAGRTLPKGSVTVDGVSLTVAELREDAFVVALVPHTLERTTLGDRRPGDRVNLEPDMVGQWVLRLLRSDGALPPR